MQYRVFRCIDAYDCKPDPAMEGLAIRLYEITIEGSDDAGNIGRDQCRVIIISSNMTIQDADAIVQKSSARFPVATTTDLGIMLETKTNIILGYIYDAGQALSKKIDATHSTRNRARERDLMIDAMLHENKPTNAIIKQRGKIEVELWMIVCHAFVAGIVASVGTAFMFLRFYQSGK
jgi:hypothetical protein